MKIATYNVNGIGARLPALIRWLAESKPDVACLQELKAPQEKFPEAAIREAGYGVIWHGQKSWNGVAILARGADPVESRRALPGDPEDLHSRYIEALIDGAIFDRDIWYALVRQLPPQSDARSIRASGEAHRSLSACFRKVREDSRLFNSESLMSQSTNCHALAANDLLSTLPPRRSWRFVPSLEPVAFSWAKSLRAQGTPEQRLFSHHLGGIFSLHDGRRCDRRDGSRRK